MIKLRLRHPKGVSSLDINPEDPITELQQTIFSMTEIAPSSQELKVGYPPQSMVAIPSLPISSLGLRNGDQLIVVASSNQTARTASVPQKVDQSNPNKPNVSVPAFEPKRQSRKEAKSPEQVSIPDGFLVHRVVPDDNSCLFSSIGILFEQDMKAAPRLRKVVVDAIKKDPDNYSDAVLGRPREEYMDTISKPSAWGGAIELAIFADYYQTEISSFDVETGRCDRFGQGRDNRAILLYSGIHYDAVSLAPMQDAPLDFHQTIYPVSNDSIFNGAQKMAGLLRDKKAFTNTATFTLKCERCGQGLTGEKEARVHASQTGHVEFGEY